MRLEEEISGLSPHRSLVIIFLECPEPGGSVRQAAELAIPGPVRNLCSLFFSAPYPPSAQHFLPPQLTIPLPQPCSFTLEMPPIFPFPAPQSCQSPAPQELSGGGELEKGRGGDHEFHLLLLTRSALEPLTSSLDSTWVLFRGKFPDPSPTYSNQKVWGWGGQ